MPSNKCTDKARKQEKKSEVRYTRTHVRERSTTKSLFCEYFLQSCTTSASSSSPIVGVDASTLPSAPGLHRRALIVPSSKRKGRDEGGGRLSLPTWRIHASRHQSFHVSSRGRELARSYVFHPFSSTPSSKSKIVGTRGSPLSSNFSSGLGKEEKRKRVCFCFTIQSWWTHRPTQMYRSYCR